MTKKKIKDACRYCGSTNVYWDKTASGKHRLFEKDTGEEHICEEYMRHREEQQVAVKAMHSAAASHMKIVAPLEKEINPNTDILDGDIVDVIWDNFEYTDAEVIHVPIAIGEFWRIKVGEDIIAFNPTCTSLVKVCKK